MYATTRDGFTRGKPMASNCRTAIEPFVSVSSTWSTLSPISSPGVGLPDTRCASISLRVRLRPICSPLLADVPEAEPRHSSIFSSHLSVHVLHRLLRSRVEAYHQCPPSAAGTRPLLSYDIGQRMSRTSQDIHRVVMIYFETWPNAWSTSTNRLLPRRGPSWARKP